MKAISKYSTGLWQWYEEGTFRWRWHDWVLAKVSLFPGNPAHKVIMTRFGANADGSELVCDIWNASYDATLESRRIDRLNSVEILQVILSD